MIVRKNQVRQRRGREPHIVGDLALQLTRVPACAAQCHQVLLGAFAGGDVGQNVAGHGQAQLRCQGQGVFPLAAAVVQDEPLLLFHRAAAHHVAAVKFDVATAFAHVDAQFFHQVGHAHGGGLVDDDAQGAFLVVLPQKSDGVVEPRVLQVRHGDQKLIGQGAGLGFIVGAGGVVLIHGRLTDW